MLNKINKLKLVIFWLKFLVKLSKTKDITRGLPRIAELFEARVQKILLLLLILMVKLSLVVYIVAYVK